MFGFLKRWRDAAAVQLLPIELPLENIQTIDRFGIEYIDNNRNSAKINYCDAYKGWCENKGIKKSNPAYICDRTKAEGWKMIFHTNLKIIFIADEGRKDLWIDVLNRIRLQGYHSFDFD